MSQEKSEGMSPTELVEAWRRNSKFLHNNPDDYSIGVKAGIDAAADGLELEIKQSNYVSGKEASESELIDDMFSYIPNIYRHQAENYIQSLLSKYRVIER